MALILGIETSSVNCSVALIKNGDIIGLKESAEGYAHSEKLHPFISEVINEADLHLKDLDGIMLGSGPGSFTGLRIGAAAAKGLCYSLNIPLMSFSSLKNLALQAKNRLVSDDSLDSNTELCALIDARRMEAYHRSFDFEMNSAAEAEALIMDAKTFEDKLHDHKVVFFGDGMNKIRDLYKDHLNALFVDGLLPGAAILSEVSEELFEKEKFEDVAYFQPFYLKDFHATTPKKKV